MAAPADAKFPNIAGRWYMNKTLGDSPEPILALQGIGWVTRKAINAAGVTLVFKNWEEKPDDADYHPGWAPPAGKPGWDPRTPDDPRVLHFDQCVTGGLKGSTETRHFDGLLRSHSDWLFGSVDGQNLFWTADEVLALDPYLAGKEAGAGPWLPADEYVWTYAESTTNGWVVTQIWGFQEVKGERRFCRNIVATKGKNVAKARLVYDYLGA